MTRTRSPRSSVVNESGASSRPTNLPGNDREAPEMRRGERESGLFLPVGRVRMKNISKQSLSIEEIDEFVNFRGCTSLVSPSYFKQSTAHIDDSIPNFASYAIRK